MQNNQIQASDNNQKTSLPESLPSVQKAVQLKDKQQINQIIRQYKLPNGAPNFVSLFKIPSKERLPELAKNNYDDTVDIVAVGVTLALQTMNLKRQMTPEQINELSETIVDSSHDDNLSLEDLILFMQRLVRGQYGELYESMDIPKFMQKFEIYREERHQEIVTYRENEHLQHKSLGSPDRSTKPETAFDEHLREYSDKLQAKNDEIKELRAREKRQWQQKNNQ